MKQKINIPQISNEQNFWMLRTKSGTFYNEFITDSFIAIGWNLITQKRVTNLTRKANEELKKSVDKVYREKRPQMAINKCSRFVNEIKENDFVVIIGTNKVTIAKIGKYYELQDNFSIETELEISEQIEKNSKAIIKCPYIKRRQIEIIKEIEITKLSPYLINTISANHHSLSSLNDSSNLILSSCFDMFIREDKFVCTFRVQQEKDIDPFDYSSFIFYISKITRLENNKSKVAIKTNVHSAGDVIYEVFQFTANHAVLFIAIWCILFGGEFKNIKINSIYSIIKEVIDRKRNVDASNLESRKKEAEIESVELDNLKKKLELVQEYSEDTVKAAQALKIKKLDPNILDINQFLSNEEISDGKK